MALPEARVVVQFAQGIETKQDRKGVMPGKMLALENSVFSKAISFVKRFGYEDLGRAVLDSDAPMPEPIALGRRGYELLAFTGTESYSYIDDASAWVAAGDVQSVICDHEAVCKTGSNQTLADMATNAGVAVYAWEDSRGGAWYSVLDDYTGRTLIAPTLIHASATRPRVHAVGANILILYVRASANELHGLRVDPTLPASAPVASVLLTDIDGALPLYDVDQDDTKAVIAYRNTGNDIGVAYIHESGVIGGGGLGFPVPTSVATPDAPVVLAVAMDKTHADRAIALAWTNVTDQRFAMLDEDLAVVTSPVSLGGSQAAQITCVFLAESTSLGLRELWISVEAADGLTHVRINETGADSEQRSQIGLFLGSKSFLDDGDAYVHTMRDTTLHRTYYTQRVSDGLCVARFLPGLAAGRILKAHLPSVGNELSAEGRAVHFAAVYVTDQESPSGNVFSEKGIRRVSLDFLSPDAFRSAQLGKSLYLAGGLVQVYDGERWQEAGFHYGPDDIAAPVLGAPTTGPGLADGTYGYVVCWENLLANGEVERGPTSPLVLVTVTGGPRRVTLQVPTYQWPSKPNARLAVFRSEDGDASVMSRVTSLDPSTAGQPNGYLPNSPTLSTVSFADEMDDATLISQDPLYTNGGIPSNDPIGPARLIAGGKNRLFFVDSSEPLNVQFTQELSEGFAAEFVPRLKHAVDAFGGDINGIIVMDDAVVAGKETALFLVEGQGPLANPSIGGGFSQPQLITSDVGIVSPDSLVYTPVGVMFQSQKGIYRLGRDRSVTYVGAPVELYNSQRVVAATLIEDRTQIRFLTDAGKTLLYDYLFDQWSTFTNHEGQDAVLVDGVYHYLRNDGSVVAETPNAYRDVNSQIRQGMETAHLKLAGHLQGWQFLWWVTIIGEWRSNHKLRMYIGFDYQEGWANVIELDPAESRVTSPYGEGGYGVGPYGGTNDTRYQFQVHVGQECEAVKFRFEDVEPTGEFGASFELTELILTGGVQRSTYGVEESRVY